MTEDLIRLTGTVAPSATVSGLRMSLGEFRAPQVATETCAIEFAISPRYKKCDEKDTYVSTVCYRIRAVTDDEEKAETGLRLHAHFDVALKIEGEHPDAAVDAFLKLNSVFVTWSYMREFVQNCTSRMQIPPLTLPLLTAGAIASLIEDNSNCDGSVMTNG